jgi:hypothetical protein
LQSWDENKNRKAGPDPIHRAWIGYDFEVLNELSEEGLIDSKPGRKSCFITKEGLARAEKIERDILGSKGVGAP